MRIFSKILFSTLLLAGASGEAFACACCSEPGSRFEATEKLDAYKSGELVRLRFTGTAKLMSDAGFPDNVKGVAAPSDKAYRLTADPIKRQMVLKLANPAGGTGQITFPLPKTIAVQQFDPGQSIGKPAKSAGGGPDLHKEWRFEGPVKLSGIFAKGAKRGTAKLIIQGHGNNCTSASDLTNWTLDIAGRGVKFGLLGSFAEPAAEVEAKKR
jgi:hypothetical protein